MDTNYLNGKSVKNKNVRVVVDDSEKEEDDFDLMKYTITRFKKNPNSANALCAHNYSLKDINNNFTLYITSCFFLYYFDHFGELPDIELCNIPHNALLWDFRNEYPDFQIESNEYKEKDRCYNFMKYIKGVLADKYTKYEISDLKILCVLINFIKNTYLANNEKVIDVFYSCVFEPTIEAILKNDIVNYNEYAYVFALFGDVHDCINILPDGYVKKMLSNALYVKFHVYHNNHTYKSIDFANAIEKYLYNEKHKENTNDKYDKLVTKLKSMKSEVLEFLIELCEELKKEQIKN